MIPHQSGSFKVTRKCCTSGRCFMCKGSPMRVVLTDHVTKEYAKMVATNWNRAGYDARVEPMEEPQRVD